MREKNKITFRYILKNIRKAEKVNEWFFFFKQMDYRVELNDGSVFIVRIGDLPCFDGGLLADILNTHRSPIVEWSDFPPFFRGPSRRLAEYLYYHY